MANNRFNTQIPTLVQPTTGGKGVMPIKGEPQKSELPMRVASYPGLPGKAGPDRSAGVPEEKIYAQAKGLRGGVDSDKY